MVGACGLATPASADEMSDGQAVFAAQKCNMCHSVPSLEIVATSKSAKMKGPDLPAGERDEAWLAGFLKREIQLDEKDHKKQFKGTEEELQAVAAWLLTLK